MDEIERAVALPEDAQPLNAYSRNYAYSDNGQIVATFSVPLPLPRIEDGCEVMTENSSSRPCTKAEIAEGLASNARAVAAQTPAGKRRWFNKPSDLPYVSDGGCNQVQIVYDPAVHRVVSVACHGIG